MTLLEKKVCVGMSKALLIAARKMKAAYDSVKNGKRSGKYQTRSPRYTQRGLLAFGLTPEKQKRTFIILFITGDEILAAENIQRKRRRDTPFAIPASSESILPSGKTGLRPVIHRPQAL